MSSSKRKRNSELIDPPSPQCVITEIDSPKTADPLATLLADLSNSRKLWATSMFHPCPHYFPPSPLPANPVILEDGVSVEELGTADIVLGPHIFMDTKFFRLIVPEKEKQLDGKLELEGVEGDASIDPSVDDNQTPKDSPVLMEQQLLIPRSFTGATATATANSAPILVDLTKPTSENNPAKPSRQSTSTSEPLNNQTSLVQTGRPPPESGETIEKSSNAPLNTTESVTPTAPTFSLERRPFAAAAARTLRHLSSDASTRPISARQALSEYLLAKSAFYATNTPPPASTSLKDASPKTSASLPPAVNNPSPSTPISSASAPSTAPVYRPAAIDTKTISSAHAAPISPSRRRSSTPSLGDLTPLSSSSFQTAPFPLSVPANMDAVHKTNSLDPNSRFPTLYPNSYLQFPYPFWGGGRIAHVGPIVEPPQHIPPPPAPAASPSTSFPDERQRTPATIRPSDWTLQQWSQMNSFLHMVREKHKAGGTSQSGPLPPTQSSVLSPADAGKATSTWRLLPNLPGDKSNSANMISSDVPIQGSLPTNTPIAAAPGISSDGRIGSAAPGFIPPGRLDPHLASGRPGNYVQWIGSGVTASESDKSKTARKESGMPEDDPPGKRRKTLDVGVGPQYINPAAGNQGYGMQLVTSASGNLSVIPMPGGHGGTFVAYEIGRPPSSAQMKPPKKPRRSKNAPVLGPDGIAQMGTGLEHHQDVTLSERDPITGELVKPKRSRLSKVPKPRKRVRPLVAFEFGENPGTRFLMPADGMVEVISPSDTSNTESAYELSMVFYLPPYRGGKVQAQQGVVVNIKNASVQLSDCIKDAMFEKAQALKKLQRKMSQLQLPGLTLDHYKDKEKGKILAEAVGRPVTLAVPRRRSEGVAKHTKRALAEKHASGTSTPRQPTESAESSQLPTEEHTIDLSGEQNHAVMPVLESVAELREDVMQALNENGSSDRAPMTAEDQSTAAPNSSAQSITNILLVQAGEEPASNTEASSAVLDASEPSGEPDASEEGQNNDAIAGASEIQDASEQLEAHTISKPLPAPGDGNGVTGSKESQASAVITAGDVALDVQNVAPQKRDGSHVDDNVTRVSARRRSVSQNHDVGKQISSEGMTSGKGRGRPRKHLSHSAPATPRPELIVGSVGEGGSAMEGKRRCVHCNSDATPMWRRGPDGPKTLCNACGVKYMLGKLCKNEEGNWIEGKRRQQG